MYYDCSDDEVPEVVEEDLTDCYAGCISYPQTSGRSIHCSSSSSSVGHRASVEMSEIIEGFLFLGSRQAAVDKKLLQAHGIKFVLNVCAEAPCYHEGTFQYLHFPLEDKATQCLSLDDHFEKAYHFIERAKESNAGILVHCVAGASRSATLVIGYLMKSKKLTFTEAFKFVQKKRPVINPNIGFMKSLIAYEHLLSKHVFGEEEAVTQSQPGSGVQVVEQRLCDRVTQSLFHCYPHFDKQLIRNCVKKHCKAERLHIDEIEKEIYNFYH